MKSIPAAVATAALLLASCSSGSFDMNNATVTAEPTATPTGDAGICQSIKKGSDGGDASMLAAFATPDGAEYGGGLIQQLVDQQGYSLDGTEMLEGHCWAYAKANGTVYGKKWEFVWRCPVTLVSDDRTTPGAMLLEQVDDKNCDFKAIKGQVADRAVTKPMERIPL